MRTSGWTKVGVVAGALAAVVALTGCQPIRYNGVGRTTESHAVWRVQPIDMSRGDGIEIRFRHCNRVEQSLQPLEGGYSSVHLRPAAAVYDATGKVFFRTTDYAGAWVMPPGSRVVDNFSSGDDLQRIFVPVAGAKPPLTIEAQCTSYLGYGMGGGFTWEFRSCTTSTRTCSPQSRGRGSYVPVAGG